MSIGSKKQTVGFRYYVGWQSHLTLGPVDEFLSMVVDDRIAFDGSVTSSGPISVNEPELFGGEKREGGIVGTFDIMFGEATQGVNSYLQGVLGGLVPAYRGVLSVVARQVYYGTNPYLKPFRWRARRTNARQFDWYGATASINGHMNAPHIFVDCWTNTEWGYGRANTTIDLASFTVAADTLFAEGFGLSLAWDGATTLAEFIQHVAETIECVLYRHPQTGLLTLDLIRNDYDPDAIRVMEPSDVVRVLSIEPTAIGDTVNEVVVVYTDDATGEDVSTAPQHNLANIRAQGRVVSTTRHYPGIYDGDLAAKVCKRDLLTLSSSMTRLKVEVKRKFWQVVPGEPIRVKLPGYDLADVVFRVVVADVGTLAEPGIVMTLVQDVFALPTAAFTTTQPSLWQSPDSVLVDIPNVALQELSYYDVATTLTPSEIGDLDPDYGFVATFAARPYADWVTYDMMASPTGSTYTQVADEAFTPRATLKNAITQLTTTLDYDTPMDVDLVVLNEYAYLVEGTAVEVVAITALDLVLKQLTVKRAVLDSIPRTFTSAAVIWFPQVFKGVDPTQRVVTETAYYKLLPRNSRGVLPLASATARNITLNNRPQRPYPAANVKINAGYYPATYTGDVTLSWAHRDRTQQTAGYNAWTEGSIGPEVGVSYTVKIYNNVAALIHTAAGLTGTSFVYTQAQEITDNGSASPNLTFEIEVHRGVYQALNTWMHTATRV